MTGRDAVTAMLRLIGAVAPGESLPAQEATDGLASLNRYIASLANDGLTIHAVTAETPLTLTAGDGTVTLGASGDITTRPISIEQALIRDGTTDMPPMRIITLAEYAAIPDKSTQATYPTALYDDGGFPQRTLTLYPVPSAAKSLVLYTKRALTALTLSGDVSLPPGYERMLIYNGAIEVAPEYGRAVPAEVAKVAIDSMAAIKRTNDKPRLLQCDPALVGGGGANIYTGGA